MCLTATILAFVCSAFFSSLLDIFSSCRAVIVMLNMVSSIVSFFQKIPAIVAMLWPHASTRTSPTTRLAAQQLSHSLTPTPLFAKEMTNQERADFKPQLKLYRSPRLNVRTLRMRNWTIKRLGNN